MESEGVKKVVLWLEEEIEKAKADVVSAKRARSRFGMYEDCGESYNEDVIAAEAALKELVRVKNKAEELAQNLQNKENEH
ncbi:hypothetical protein ACTOJ1_001245 [Shigella flexneri]